MRDNRFCGPACTEPYAPCIGESHCAHGTLCIVGSCLCSCHSTQVVDVTAHAPDCQCMKCAIEEAHAGSIAAAPMPALPEYYLRVSKDDLWECCLRHIITYVSAAFAAGVEIKDGHRMNCSGCNGSITLRGKVWR